MGAGQVLQELSDVMMGSGQLVADEIANTTRNGCFEYCDGWPEELRREAGSIMLATVKIIEDCGISDEGKEALLQRGRDYAERCGVVHAICRKECPGAYSLFTEDEELDDANGEPVVKECPVSVRLSTALEEAKTD